MEAAAPTRHLRELPWYAAQGDECALFEQAFQARLPLLLKGPTGCGKTRLVEHMAVRLGRPLITVSGHDDLGAADLTGRHLIAGGSTRWCDGPLTRAVREGAIFYLDEVVEARKDITVVLHPLADDRRMLPLERTGRAAGRGTGLHAGAVSYNPGYQNAAQGPQAQHAPALRRADAGLPGARAGSAHRGRRGRLRPDTAARLVQLARAAPPDRARPGGDRQHAPAGDGRAAACAGVSLASACHAACWRR
jgi:nitric oxide reductase NorQ protein